MTDVQSSAPTPEQLMQIAQAQQAQQSAPLAQQMQQPAPAVQPVQQPAPAVQPVQQPAPTAQQMQQPAPTAQQMQQPAPAAPAAPAQTLQNIIDQQNAQIAALMAQNSNLNQQVISMVQNGAQLSSAQDQATTVPAQNASMMPSQIEQMAQLGAQPDPLGSLNPVSLSTSKDYSLDDLAKEIGTK